MKIDILVAEIGSTTTVLNAFNDFSRIGQGFAKTSVLEGDVSIGLNQALDNLCQNLGVADINYTEFFATSSAAGGLKMTVHGLIYDMTAKAAKDAALGAGGNISLITAGDLADVELNQITQLSPNLILLAGGVDYGDRQNAINNAKKLAKMPITAPIIYCGNIQNQLEIKEIFETAGKKIYITENVYPKIDELNINPVRTLIHRAFEEHITEARGMEKIRQMVNSAIIPTPGAVMQAAMLLHGEIGNLLVVDIGGATTDIHSVADESDDIAKIQINAEPFAKRTVEGDLGLYINAQNVATLLNETVPANLPYIPQNESEIGLVERLSFVAGKTAIERHAGRIKHTYGASGRKNYAVGKDLTAIQHIIGTGGALTRLPNRLEILKKLTKINENGSLLYPNSEQIKVLVDNDYIMAAAGVLSMVYPTEALKILKKSLGIKI